MGTAGGIPERRYHAWMVGATTPPVGRMVGLQSCMEWLVLEGNAVPTPIRLELSSLRYGDGTVSPKGIDALERFELQAGASATWEYAFTNELGSVHVTRSLLVPREKNAVVVRYSVRWTASAISSSAPSNPSSAKPAASGHLEIRPLISLRDFHQVRPNFSPADTFETRRVPGDNGCVVAYSGPTGITGQPLTVCAWGTLGRCFFREDPETWRNIYAIKDEARGQDCLDTLFSPGILTLPIGGPASPTSSNTSSEVRLELRAHIGGTEHQPDGFETELVRINSRRAGLVNDILRLSPQPISDRDGAALAALAVAGDQFIVRRDMRTGTDRPTSLASVIAGYPWFSDWGRDTFISMPGLFFATGRMGEAFDALAAFAALLKDGLVPNCFDDGSGLAWYNTVDASLWFVHAACEYLRRTDDRLAFQDAIEPACLEIIRAYEQGTRYSIGMDPADALIAAGDQTTQLTWMDAKRNGVVFTPRHGKAVEINALWFSALHEVALALGPDHPKATHFKALAARVGESIRSKFWNATDNCLYDVLTKHAPDQPWTPVADIRPNQIFAVSLPHSPLSSAQQRAVVACVKERLLTPLGLRTLDAKNEKYAPRFEGDLMKRDGAYHNGTVWPWLLGPYCSAVLAVGARNDASKHEVRALLDPLLTQLTGPWTRPTSILTLTEVYDADEPRRPDGCMAQAWSIAELLRVLQIVATKP